MKINPEKIILESKDFHFKKKIFLISGNEETLIKKIQHILIQKIRNEGFGEIQKNQGFSIVTIRKIYKETLRNACLGHMLSFDYLNYPLAKKNKNDLFRLMDLLT